MQRTRVSPIVVLTCLTMLLIMGQAGEASQWTLVTVLHTNDIHGNVAPRNDSGGLARAATLVRQIRTVMPNVVLLDAGDIIHGTPEDYLSRGKATISAMNAASYDAAATGNHEYDFGLDALEEVISTATFPFLAANVNATSGENWNGLAPSIVLNAGGIRIGVIGLATLETVSLHWPGSIKDIRVYDPIETAKLLVPKVRESVDVLIILSHLGIDLDRILAREIDGIDFIIGGHSHTAIDQWEWVGNTLIAQTGAYCRALGRIDFIVRKNGTKAEIWSVNGKTRRWNELPRPPLGLRYPDGPLVAVGNSIEEDRSVLQAYLPFRKNADKYLSQEVGFAQTDIPGRTDSQDESPSANLMADAVREFAQSDVAIVDANAVGARKLTKGPIRVEDL
ncbi:MAG: bifunctional UDP-sugar hydrolase/5'-nucleotidase, partial [Armatimonadota bacterium]|nr:bifunctional UDP-sugar hydrolase/5'-nucleotidase [Armatimonadota bacterium]